MSKGAAKQDALSKVHSLVTAVFTRVLEKYLEDLDRADNTSALTPEQIEDGMLAEIAMMDINPAMLGAVTKFLKDNSISFDDEAVSKLTGLQESLAARRDKRSNVVDLTTLRAVGDE